MTQRPDQAHAVADASLAPVVIVDDDALIRHYLQEVLSNAGYAVHCVSSAREGLTFCMRNSPAAVLTDLVMPEQDGIEFIRSLRAAGITAPIIAMSGGGQIQPTVYLDMAVRLGASAALQKPFSNAELLTVLAAQLTRA